MQPRNFRQIQIFFKLKLENPNKFDMNFPMRHFLLGITNVESSGLLVFIS